MECVVTPGGHEIDFDRILVEELTALGHSVEFYVPEGHQFKWDYGMPVHHLKGTGVSYKGAHGLKKLVLAARREWHRQKWYTQMYALACEDKFDAIIFPSATYRYLRALKRRKGSRKSDERKIHEDCGKRRSNINTFSGPLKSKRA